MTKGKGVGVIREGRTVNFSNFEVFFAQKFRVI
jgi:hypothetical protein